MREWKGLNLAAFEDEQRHAAEAISTQLHELSAAIKRLSEGRTPDAAALAVSGGGASDHGALTGLADDDHVQYPLLAGRAGGQTLLGGTAASETLVLRGSSADTDTVVTISADASSSVPLLKVADATTWVSPGGSSLVVDVNGAHSGGSNSLGTFFRVRNTNGAGTNCLTAAGGGTDAFVGLANNAMTVDTRNFNPSDTATISGHNAASSGLVVKGASSQSDNIQEWRDSSNSVLSKIRSNGTFDGPINVAAVSLTGQTANIATTNLLTAPAAGVYEVELYLMCTTADAAAGTLTVTIGWTDNVGAATSTPITGFALTATGRTTGRQLVRVNSSNLTYAVAITGGYGTSQYAIYARVVSLG